MRVRRNRNVLAITVGQAVNTLGQAITGVTLTLRLHATGHSGWWIAAMLLAEMLPMVVLSPLTGLLADRHDAKRLLLVASLWESAMCVLLAYVVSPLATVAVVALFATASALAMPVFATMVPRTVERDQLPRAYALVQTAIGFTGIVGPAIGGVLAGMLGYQWPLLVQAVTALGITVVALVVRLGPRENGDPADQGADRTGGGRALDGARVLLRDRPLAAAVLLVLAIIVALEAFGVAEVFLVRDVLGGGEQAYGLAGAMWAAGALLGSALVGRVRGDATMVRSIPAACAGAAAMILCVSVVPSLGWLYPPYVLAGIANGWVNTAFAAVIPMRVPGSMLGRVS
ncbi:MAG TPA: MFS transporter, partial [Actinopolymorphaceae bacterium]